MTHHSLTRTAVTALILAVFMLVNAVVVLGEEAIHSVQEEVLAQTHHDGHLAEHVQGHDTEKADCASHHSCHSHSPLVLAGDDIGIPIPGPTRDWLPLNGVTPDSPSYSPPVPPPDSPLQS